MEELIIKHILKKGELTKAAGSWNAFKGELLPPFALSQPQGGLDGVERGSAWGAVFRLSRAGFYSDLNPDTVCNPRQVLPLSWESSFLLEFACLLQCTCDLWGREEDNVPKLRTFWECLGRTEVLWAAGALLVKTLLPPWPHQYFARKQLSSWQLWCSRHPQWHQETALKGGIFLNGRDSPHFPNLRSKTVALEFPEIREVGWFFFSFFLCGFFIVLFFSLQKTVRQKSFLLSYSWRKKEVKQWTLLHAKFCLPFSYKIREETHFLIHWNWSGSQSC